jgi:hypothetical protein
MAVCAAFGVDPSGAPAPPNIPPGLVVTMRSMASGAMGPSADRAQSALREMASALLAPDREVAALSELALRSGGREVPPITPFLPGQPAAAPAPAPPPAPAPAAPAPYVPNVSPGTPVRSPVSYEAPDRSVQTYPSIPAYKPSEPEPAPPEARPSAAPVPTWADAPARTSTPAEPAAAASTTNPPATAPPAPVEPAAPRSPFEGYTPVETPASTPTPPAAEPTPPPAPTWSPVEPPVWKPGEIAVPAVAAAAAAVTPAAPSPTPPTAPPAPLPAPTRPPEPIRRPTVARPQYGGPPERPAWLIPAAVAVVVVLLLGIGGVVLANRGGSPKPAGSPSPTGHAPLTVPSFGDAKNDPITKVQFCSTAAPCPIAVGTPNETGTTCDLTACTIEVAFYFSSSQKSTPVAYNLKFFDRCSGQTTDLSGPSASTSSSGYIVAIPADKWPVRIPSGVKSGALVAVASKPAVAASAPLLLGADTCP